MRRLFAAVAFLSRLPVRNAAGFDAADVGRSTLLFPVVGALLGGILAAFEWALGGKLPPLVGAGLILALSALTTGALHLDGLADMADGFGGGKTREDVLRIMRDHHVGAYGVTAIVLALIVKAGALAALAATANAPRVLIAAGALSRWSAVPLARFLPYARREDGAPTQVGGAEGAVRGGLGAALTDHVGRLELIGSTLLAGAIAVALLGPLRGLVLWAGASVVTFSTGRMCQERIGGVTGDTLGANTELCETFAWVLAVALG